MALKNISTIILISLTLAGMGFIVQQRANANSDPTEECPTSQGLRWLAEHLNRKELMLVHREHTLEAKEADLIKVQENLDKKLVELQTLREEVRQQLQTIDNTQEEHVLAAVKMLETMRPKEGAAVLAETERDVALEVLARMNQSKAGKLLAKMEAKKASSLLEDYTTTPKLEEK